MKEASDEIHGLKKVQDGLARQLVSLGKAIDRRKRDILSIDEWQERIFGSNPDSSPSIDELREYVRELERKTVDRERHQTHLEEFLDDTRSRIEGLMQLVQEMQCELDRRCETVGHPCGEVFRFSSSSH